MHTIEPARLKPGVSADFAARLGIPGDRLPATSASSGDARSIFWDPMSLPGTRLAKKLDAIDTDQITPAADCVSESLDTLDERWKAGSFRYLMPDFRARVHRGETFVIAGDRFAIGSSREMSPAGLKGVAEEAGLELVVVCGANMGDIFRRNSFNLGLHVVQSPEAVADARDGDEFSFDPATPPAAQRDAATRPTTRCRCRAKEEEIRRSGGIFAVGRREFKRSVAVTPRRSTGPPPELARRMSTTEQIVWAHRVDKDLDAGGASRRARRCASTPTCCRRPTAPRRSRSTRSTRSPAAPPSIRVRRRSPTITSCSPASRPTTSRPRIGREFARAARHRASRYYATPGDGIFHFYFPEQGLVMPGQFIPGADSHSRAYGAYGAVGIGVGLDHARIRLVDRLHLLHAGEAAARRLPRAAAAVGRRQGHRARAAAALGREAVAGHVGRARRSRISQLPMAYRNTIANMMAEAEALNGIFAPDDIDRRVVSPEGRRELPYPPIAPGPDAIYDIDETLDLTDVRPMIAKPFSPGNAFPADEVAREHITFDKAMIGSCTNGSYDDLLQAALVMRAARDRGVRKVEREFAIFPGSGGVGRQIETAGPPARRRIDRRGVPIGRRPDPPVVVRSVFRPGTGCADARAARDHVVQSQLAESHGARRRGLPRQPGDRRRVGAGRLHGAADRARPELGRGAVRCRECARQRIVRP